MRTIMVVDDSATSRMFIIRCLQMVLTGGNENQFFEAANGKEALAKLKERPTDLAVIDLNMPVMDGTTLLRWMKSSPKLTLIPVVVITSADNPANREELKKLGARHVLSKPVAPTKLIPVINELFNIEADQFGF
jgi:two-component system, chemotaxis family, chemotaxis protein CheY